MPDPTKFTIATVSHKVLNRRGLFAMRDYDNSLIHLNPRPNVHINPEFSFEDDEWTQIREGMMQLRDVPNVGEQVFIGDLIIETHP